MEFKIHAPGAVEIQTRCGARFLYSYGVAVVAFYEGGYWRTDRYISHTTERHIVAFVDPGAYAVKVPHDQIQRAAREAC